MKDHRKNKEKYLEKELLAPYTHLSQRQGQVLATKISCSFNYWLKVPDDVVVQVTDILTIMLNGILLIDDIQYNSLIRRKVPTAHCVYGLPLTINAGSQVISEALQKVIDLVPTGLGSKLFADSLHEIWVGQGTEIYWRDNFICPTEESYKKMHQQKTGSYINLGVKLLQVLSHNKEDYDYIIDILGYYSQLRDDYCNLRAKELNQDSSFCEDLTEGKFTLPIIHASKTDAGQEVLKQGGSLQYTRDRLGELDREARAEVSRLGRNPILESVLDELSSWKGGNFF